MSFNDGFEDTHLLDDGTASLSQAPLILPPNVALLCPFGIELLEVLAELGPPVKEHTMHYRCELGKTEITYYHDKTHLWFWGWLLLQE